MTQDPLCDWLQTQCTVETCAALRLGDPCEHQWCQCELIAKVRADERSRKGTCWREAEGSQIPAGAIRVYREAGWFWEMP